MLRVSRTPFLSRAVFSANKSNSHLLNSSIGHVCLSSNLAHSVESSAIQSLVSEKPMKISEILRKSRSIVGESGIVEQTPINVTDMFVADNKFQKNDYNQKSTSQLRDEKARVVSFEELKMLTISENMTLQAIIGAFKKCHQSRHSLTEVNYDTAEALIDIFAAKQASFNINEFLISFSSINKVGFIWSEIKPETREILLQRILTDLPNYQESRKEITILSRGLVALKINHFDLSDPFKIQFLSQIQQRNCSYAPNLLEVLLHIDAMGFNFFIEPYESSGIKTYLKKFLKLHNKNQEFCMKLHENRLSDLTNIGIDVAILPPPPGFVAPVGPIVFRPPTRGKSVVLDSLEKNNCTQSTITSSNSNINSSSNISSNSSNSSNSISNADNTLSTAADPHGTATSETISDLPVISSPIVPLLPQEQHLQNILFNDIAKQNPSKQTKDDIIRTITRIANAKVTTTLSNENKAILLSIIDVFAQKSPLFSVKEFHVTFNTMSKIGFLWSDIAESSKNQFLNRIITDFSSVEFTNRSVLLLGRTLYALKVHKNDLSEEFITKYLTKLDRVTILHSSFSDILIQLHQLGFNFNETPYKETGIMTFLTKKTEKFYKNEEFCLKLHENGLSDLTKIGINVALSPPPVGFVFPVPAGSVTSAVGELQTAAIAAESSSINNSNNSNNSNSSISSNSSSISDKTVDPTALKTPTMSTAEQYTESHLKFLRYELARLRKIHVSYLNETDLFEHINNIDKIVTSPFYTYDDVNKSLFTATVNAFGRINAPASSTIDTTNTTATTATQLSEVTTDNNSNSSKFNNISNNGSSSSSSVDFYNYLHKLSKLNVIWSTDITSSNKEYFLDKITNDLFQLNDENQHKTREIILNTLVNFNTNKSDFSLLQQKRLFDAIRHHKFNSDEINSTFPHLFADLLYCLHQMGYNFNSKAPGHYKVRDYITENVLKMNNNHEFCARLLHNGLTDLSSIGVKLEIIQPENISPSSMSVPVPIKNSDGVYCDIATTATTTPPTLIPPATVVASNSTFGALKIMKKSKYPYPSLVIHTPNDLAQALNYHSDVGEFQQFSDALAGYANKENISTDDKAFVRRKLNFMLVPSLLDKLDSTVLVDITTSLGKMDYNFDIERNAELFNNLVNTFNAYKSLQITPQSVTTFVNAMQECNGLFLNLPEALKDPFLNQILVALPKFGVEEVSSVLYSLSRMDVKWYDFSAQLQKSFENILKTFDNEHKFNIPDKAKLVYALGKLDCTSDFVQPNRVAINPNTKNNKQAVQAVVESNNAVNMSQLVTKFIGDVLSSERLESASVVTVFAGLRQLELPFSTQTIEWQQSLLKAVESHLEALDTLSFVTLMDGFSRMGLNHATIPATLTTKLETKLLDSCEYLEPEELAILLRAMANLSLRFRTVSVDLRNKVELCVENTMYSDVKSKHVVSIVYGLSGIQAQWSKLQPSTREAVLKMVANIEPRERERAVLMDRLSLLGVPLSEIPFFSRNGSGINGASNGNVASAARSSGSKSKIPNYTKPDFQQKVVNQKASHDAAMVVVGAMMASAATVAVVGDALAPKKGIDFQNQYVDTQGVVATAGSGHVSNNNDSNSSFQGSNISSNSSNNGRLFDLVADINEYNGGESYDYDLTKQNSSSGNNNKHSGPASQWDQSSTANSSTQSQKQILANLQQTISDINSNTSNTNVNSSTLAQNSDTFVEMLLNYATGSAKSSNKQQKKIQSDITNMLTKETIDTFTLPQLTNIINSLRLLEFKLNLPAHQNLAQTLIQKLTEAQEFGAKFDEVLSVWNALASCGVKYNILTADQQNKLMESVTKLPNSAEGAKQFSQYLQLLVNLKYNVNHKSVEHTDSTTISSGIETNTNDNSNSSNSNKQQLLSQLITHSEHLSPAEIVSILKYLSELGVKLDPTETEHSIVCKLAEKLLHAHNIAANNVSTPMITKILDSVFGNSISISKNNSGDSNSNSISDSISDSISTTGSKNSKKNSSNINSSSNKLKSIQITELLTALSVLDIRYENMGDALKASILALLEKELHSFVVRDIGGVYKALGLMQFQWAELPVSLKDTLQSVAAEKLDKMKPFDVSITLHGLASMDAPFSALSPDLQRTIESVLLKRLSRMSGRSVAGAVHALAKMQVSFGALPSQLQATVQEAVGEKLSAMEGVETAMTVHGLGKMSASWSNLTTTARESILHNTALQLENMDYWSVSNVLYGLCCMGAKYSDLSTELQSKVLESVEKNMKKEEENELQFAITLYSLGQLSTSWSVLPTTLTSALLETLGHKLGSADWQSMAGLQREQHVAMVVHGLAGMQVKVSELPVSVQELLQRKVVTSMTQMDPVGVGITLHSLAKMGILWSELSADSATTILSNVSRALNTIVISNNSGNGTDSNTGSSVSSSVSGSTNKDINTSKDGSSNNNSNQMKVPSRGKFEITEFVQDLQQIMAMNADEAIEISLEQALDVFVLSASLQALGSMGVKYNALGEDSQALLPQLLVRESGNMYTGLRHRVVKSLVQMEFEWAALSADRKKTLERSFIESFPKMRASEVLGAIHGLETMGVEMSSLGENMQVATVTAVTRIYAETNAKDRKLLRKWLTAGNM